jgi:HK97 family phage major capsid protein
MSAEILRSKVDALRAEVTALADASDDAYAALPAADAEALRARLEFAIPEYTAAKAEYDTVVERAKAVEAVRAAVTEEIPGYDFKVKRTSDESIDMRTATRSQLRDAALRIVEGEGKSLAPRQLDHVDRLLRGAESGADSSEIARRVVLTENDAYRSAYMKAVTNPNPRFTAEEGAALDAFQGEFSRTANEGTGSAGGFGIPVLIDPSIILTSGAVGAPIVDISRVVTITTDAWKGVSAAASSWAYQAESAVVADGTPVLAQPVITVYAARGFIPYTIEVGQDYPGFAEEMSNLLGQGYLDLLAVNTETGSGASQPRGIFTAVSANTTAPTHVTVTTAGTIDGVSLRKTWGNLPERFRKNATWVVSPTVDAQIRGLGNNLAMSDYTVNLLADGTSTLFGRPVIVDDYAPAFTGTTGAANYAVVGDFSQGFLIVQRAGMTVELVNHLFDTTTGRPTGQRGWFAWSRHGYDVVNQNAFRLMSNS